MHRHWLSNTILVAGLPTRCHTAAATEFDLDDGTAQGWDGRLLINDGTASVPRGQRARQPPIA